MPVVECEVEGVMPTKPEMATHTIAELQGNAATIVKQVAQMKQPVRIKANGHPSVVVLDEDTYDKYIHLINLTCMLNEGMEDIRLGRARPIEEFLREFEDAKNIPRRSKRRSAARR